MSFLKKLKEIGLKILEKAKTVGGKILQSPIWTNAKRTSVDLIALITIGLLMVYAPEDYLPIVAKANLITLFFTKFIIVSAAIVHAHITRKLLFPYINFAEDEDLTNNIMVITWYVIVIFGWTRGG